MAKPEFLKMERFSNHVQLILNRPERKNALNLALAQQLADTLELLKKDDQIKIIVMRGAGDCFSAGGDLKHFYENLEIAYQDFDKVSEALNRAILAMQTMPQLVIAAVTGPAFAAAFGLVLACDWVVATQEATLSPSFSNIALAPNAATTYNLPRILGEKRALEAFVMGKTFTATEALQMGLINQVCEKSKLEKDLAQLIETILQRPGNVIGRIKQLLKTSSQFNLAQQLQHERNQISASASEENFKIGVTAFVNKQKPVFK